MRASRRVVVVVSGGGAISPFTTPTSACAGGLPAGSTDTALRAALLDAGLAVYTSPANVGRRPVTRDPEPNGFDGQPEQLPADLTVDAAGSIDRAGAHLARFLAHLAECEGATDVDLVAHSMGGLFSRSAVRELTTAGHPLRIRSLTTIGTPWTGSYVAAVANDLATPDAAAGDEHTLGFIAEFRTWLIAAANDGAARQVVPQFIAGWNERQAGVLGGIPVTLIAGDWFRHEAGSVIAWPHDALVSVSSALADGLSVDVLPASPRHVFPDVHSIFYADRIGVPWERALTWDPEVHRVVVDAIAAA